MKKLNLKIQNLLYFFKELLYKLILSYKLNLIINILIKKEKNKLKYFKYIKVIIYLISLILKKFYKYKTKEKYNNNKK